MNERSGRLFYCSLALDFCLRAGTFSATQIGMTADCLGVLANRQDICSQMISSASQRPNICESSEYDFRSTKLERSPHPFLSQALGHFLPRLVEIIPGPGTNFVLCHFSGLWQSP